MHTNYIRHPNPTYRNNPLIEALGLPLLPAELVKKCRRIYQNELNLENLDQAYHGYYQRTAIDNLNRFHEPRDELYRIYDLQRRMIESGLVKRNPLVLTDKSIGIPIMAVLDAINDDLKDSKKDVKSTSPESKWIKSLNVKKLGFAEVEHSYVLAGLSGAGKTTLIEAILQCENQVIHHDKYIDHNGTEYPFRMTQIQKLYIKIDNRKGQKSTLLSILEGIDALIDEDYSLSHKSSDVRVLIAAVRKAVVIHGVGLIIFDEAQNLAPTSKNDSVGSSERTTMKFLEEIFNHVAVPTFFVGTFSILNLFSKEMTIARRSAKDGCTLLASCSVESPFWDRLCKVLFEARLLKSQKTEYEIFKLHIHQLAAGLPSIAVSLTRSTLNFLTFLEPKNQDLSIQALDKIYREQFEILHKPLEALRAANYKGYEDFEPMYLLNNVESVIKSQFSNSQKVQEIEKLLTGNPTIEKLFSAAAINTKACDFDQLAETMSPDAILDIVQSAPTSREE